MPSVFSRLMLYTSAPFGTADDHSFQISIDGEIVSVVPRTTSRMIHRYKACATQPSSRPGWQAADGAR
jgi:hypothetical protein